MATGEHTRNAPSREVFDADERAAKAELFQLVQRGVPLWTDERRGTRYLAHAGLPVWVTGGAIPPRTIGGYGPASRTSPVLTARCDERNPSARLDSGAARNPSDDEGRVLIR